MNLNERVTLCAQTQNGPFAEDGLHPSGRAVMAIYSEQGLLAFAQGDSTMAQLALEVLLDDMSLNLPAIDVTSSQAGSAVALCLSESLENINEYLNEQGGDSEPSATDLPRGLSMACLQLLGNQLSYVQTGDLCCLHYSAQRLHALADDESAAQLLGLGLSIRPVIQQTELREGDVYILTSQRFVQLITLEFLRVTLSRFSDNLEMAMRQINTRALRNGLQQKPDILLCRIDPVSANTKSWLGKFRKA